MMLFLSLRYEFPHSKSLKSRSIRIMLTVALSLVVTVVVISIMTYLQSSRFTSIRDVRSFDYVVDGNYEDEIKALLPESEVFVYGEGEALSEEGSFLVRYIDSSYDGGVEYYIGDASTLAVPFSFYLKNGFDDVTLSMLKSGRAITTLKSESYKISGIYRTALGSEFDDTMLFLPLTDADENASLKTAVRGISEKDAALLTQNGYSVTSWKEAESSLYGAFLVEKTLMYGVLSLLFIIIAVSTKSSVVLFFSVREKEMAELEILGLKKGNIRMLSLLSFSLVILFGIALGYVLSLGVLELLEIISNNSTHILSLTLSLPYGGFLFFSLFMLFVTVIFTFFESRKREKKEISEVLYAE